MSPPVLLPAGDTGKVGLTVTWPAREAMGAGWTLHGEPPSALCLLALCRIETLHCYVDFSCHGPVSAWLFLGPVNCYAQSTTVHQLL